MIKYLQILAFTALCFNTSTLFSQTGPGGVGSSNGSSDLVIWLRPDNSGNTNRKWVDQSGKGYDFTVGTGALLRSNAVNGYNAYTFNGINNYFQKSAETDFNTNEFSIFSASKVLSSKEYKAVFSYRDEYNWNSGLDEKYGFTLYALPDEPNTWSFWTGKGASKDGWMVLDNPQSTVGNWSVQNINFKNGRNGKSIFINSNSVTASNQTMGLNTDRPFRVGAGKNESIPDYFFKGDIGEIIMYKSVINEAQHIIVGNYLAAKYNSSLSSAEDFYLQDNPENGDFDHHVAGIGKTTGDISHTDSQGTGIVRVNNPSRLANNSFLFWGEDIKDSNYNFITNSSNYYEQLNSKWRVSKKGTVETVDVSFDLTKAKLSQWNRCTELQLVVANNSNFTALAVYPLTISSAGIATATKIRFNDGDYFTIRYVNQIVWNGTEYFNGSRPNFAPNNTNDKCLKLLVKAGNKAVLTQNAYVKQIEVEPGATLEVADGVELSVENGIINSGTIDLLGEAQLKQNHTGSNMNSGNGKLKITQQGTTNLHNYNYWSAPVHRKGSWQIGFLEQNNRALNFDPAHNANPNTIPITLSSRWLYTYDLFENLGYQGWNRINKTTEIPPGIGYTMKGSGSTALEEEYVFSGEANSGYYEYKAAAGYDFLIGNPYPSALNAIDFIIDNINVTDGTLLFYEQFATNKTHILRDYEGGYATLNLLAGVAAAADPQLGNGGSPTKGKPTNNIAIGQGFFVNIKENSTIKFNNAQRVFAKESMNESVFYRQNSSTSNTDTRTKFWLNFTDPSGRAREIALGYDQNATEGFDKGYDAIDYSDYPDHMLWDVTDNLLVIQGLKQFNMKDDMLLSIKITTPGTYTIRLSETINFPENTAIYLKDNHKNIFYDLSSDDVSLTFAAGIFNNQYSIVYQRDTLSVPTVENSTSVYVKFDKNSDKLQLLGVENLKDIYEAYIYSVDGKQMRYIKGLETSNINVSSFSDGIYILKLKMISGATQNIRFSKY